MASPVNALICALVATAFWSLVGYALGCRLVPRALAIGSAPVVGWSVHSAATLPIYLLFGFSPFLVAGIAAVGVLVAGFSLSRPRPAGETEPARSVPVWAFAAAALIALLPALGRHAGRCTRRWPRFYGAYRTPHSMAIAKAAKRRPSIGVSSFVLSATLAS
jgi:hypothetical protein